MSVDPADDTVSRKVACIFPRLVITVFGSFKNSGGDVLGIRLVRKEKQRKIIPHI